MIVRVIVKNLFSFKEETEFNLTPSKVTRLKHHKYKVNNIELLKLSAIYGANGAGKSNLVRSISLLKRFVTSGNIQTAFLNQKFKLSQLTAKQPIELAIEFYNKSKFFFYTISIDQGRVIEEQLSLVTPNAEGDEILFHRFNNKEETKIRFYKEFERNESNVLLKELIEKDLLKKNKSLLNLLSTLSNESFNVIKEAYNWFEDKLIILYPTTKPTGLSLQLEQNSKLKQFANNLICSFNTGISSLKIESNSIKDFLGEDNQKEVDEITTRLTNNTNEVAEIHDGQTGDIIYAINEDGEIKTKRLFFEHLMDNEESVKFSFKEESDGTRRLIEYIPALNDIINNDRTYVIDEIERSIHPIMIKELLSKFSNDESTKGQLIFTTHECNLLDQDILRTDEIWFAQKDIWGATNLYSLSDFKEHSTIDIRKGYLNGRYGAIPFAGNLHDLNWNNAK